MHRRNFLAGLGAAIAAPALVRASSLDYVPQLDAAARRAQRLLPWVDMGRPGAYSLTEGRYDNGVPMVPFDANYVEVRYCEFGVRNWYDALQKSRISHNKELAGVIAHNRFIIYPPATLRHAGIHLSNGAVA